MGAVRRRFWFGDVELENHVERALRWADSFAAMRPLRAGDALGRQPVGAGDVLRGALRVAEEGGVPGGTDSSFKWLAEMCGHSLPPAASGEARSANSGPLPLASQSFAPALAVGTDLLGRSLGSGKPRWWGRDLLTAALLARNDPTLADFAAEAGLSVARIQDAWYTFVTTSEHRDRADWGTWWRTAGVPLPSERLPPRIIDTGWHPLADGMPPEWASGWGQDRYGVYVEFTLAEVTQRLRWIPPGRFMMGAPEDEPGYQDMYGPQHEVTVEEGFWLFATSVTQALYEAVIGENPSNFTGGDRPVERVSWQDAMTFLARLNEWVPGLDLVLPSEAQWEYACRAGTTTATYEGDLRNLPKGGDEVLDPIAWYGDNSGGESHPVALKKPNEWGLYDTLGNVWEWCADHWHESYEGALSDGSAWLNEDAEDGAFRVFRGGSWGGEARNCRAAARFRSRPDGRDDYVGFRPARGQG